MPKTIWKYPLPVGVEFTLQLPEGAEVMAVRLQQGHVLDNQPVIWALVDPGAPKVAREFSIYATGDPIEGPIDLFGYVDTWQSGGLVWHLFEVLPKVTVRTAACTDLSASWCPVHGDCTCPRDSENEVFEDAFDCPLHGKHSTHAEVGADDADG